MNSTMKFININHEKKKKDNNILTLSDGEISDQESTKINADNLYNRINKKFDNINSQAIRFISYKNAQFLNY